MQDILLTFLHLQEMGIPFCRVHLGRLVKAGKFPAPIRLSTNRVAWRRADIEEWLKTRPEVRPAATAAQ